MSTVGENGENGQVGSQLQKLSLDEEQKLSSSSAVMHLILQSSDVGKIIGPKGATVEGFKQKSGASISFSDYQPAVPR